MAGAQKLSYALALSSPPPKNSSRPIKRLPAVFSRRGRGSRSSRTPTHAVITPRIEKPQFTPASSPGDWSELESQSRGVKIGPQECSRLVNFAPLPSDPMPRYGVWKEMETEIEEFKTPSKRQSRFSGFFASPDYRKRLEMTKKTKLTETSAESTDLFSGIIAWQGDRIEINNHSQFHQTSFGKTQDDELVKSHTESTDPFHPWISDHESPTMLKEVAELVATPTLSSASLLEFFPSDPHDESLSGGLYGDGDAFDVIRASTQPSIFAKVRPLNVYRHRHSGSMSSADDGDYTSAVPHCPYIQASPEDLRGKTQL
ncbi:hypothetical protein FGG08_005962 [Glutinoglossum americanum]|uniref:Uncharacterized protein n=1 Tax=Glutinoglossum americanum TaxID=1670608 RepID=A0A9P8I280_9PEZI|nr:hypothetical protein FGG08_005962 [Glutinoglossum americanum]